MKTLLLVLLLASTAVPVWAEDQNLLKNGDFADGSGSWQGDCRSPGSEGDGSFSIPTASPSGTGGVTITLRERDWTKIYQEFEGNAGQYLLTVTCSVSPGITYSTEQRDYSNLPSKLNLVDMKPFKSSTGKWVMMVVDLGAKRFAYWKISPNTDSSVIQSITCDVKLPTNNGLKTFYLAFPPGNGVISLKSISLVPKD